MAEVSNSSLDPAPAADTQAVDPLKIETTATAPTVKGATLASTKVAREQLDSDDEDISKRSKLVGKNAFEKDQNYHRLRRDRARLYELQESKRRRREDTTAQGRRSKEKKEGDETSLLQKVKRLKSERKAVEDEYATVGSGLRKKNQRKNKKKRSLGIPLPKP